MSKEAWFREYERLDAEMEAGEIPQMTEDELADAAHEAMIDWFVDTTDTEQDRRRERDHE